MMSEELDDFNRRMALQDQAHARVLAAASISTSPDEAARRIRTSRVSGLPTNVASLPDDPAREAARAAADATSRAPSFAQWLRMGGDRAALARGAEARFADTQEAFAARANRGSGDGWAVRAPYAPPSTQMRQSREAARRSSDPQGFTARAQMFIHEALGGENERGGNFLRDDLGSPSRVLSSLKAGVGDFSSAVAGAASAALEADLEPGLLDFSLNDVAQTLGFNPAALTTRRAEGWRDYATAAMPQGSGTSGDAVLGGVRSLPLSAVALVGGAYAGGAKIAAGVMGTAAFGGSYLTGRDAGLDANAAANFALRDAAVEVATEYLPFATLLNRAGGGFLARVAKSAVEEVGGEIAAQNLQDLNAFLTFEQDQGRSWDQFLAERGNATFDASIGALVGSGAMGSAVGAAEFAARRMGRNLTRTMDVEHNEALFSALNKLSAANEVLQRDPQSFAEFVDLAAEGSGATEVFIEAAELATVLNQSGLTVEEVYAATGMTPEAIQLAADRGDDVSFPVGQYAANIAALPMAEGLLPHLRTDPDQMSRAQAEVSLQGANEEFARAAEDALDGTEAAATRAASRARVEEAILAELNSTKRFAGRVNETYAAVLSAFFDRQGARGGKTAEEFAQEYVLKVQASRVQEPTFDQKPDPFDDITNLLSRDDWAVMTAENPDAQQLSPEENATRNAALRQRLDEMGLTYREVKGKYGSDENSFAISGITREQAMQLGAQFKQESVLTHEGLVYPDGTVNPAKGVSLVGAEQEDFFSTLPDGTRFAVEINFDERVALRQQEGGKPKGDGRRFRDFFAGITSGASGAPDNVNAVRLFDTSSIADFESEYTQHMGKFDNHIGASIPGFREVQIAVGAALAEAMPQGGRMLDIAGSEGALAKAIAAKRPDVSTVVLDPNPAMRDTFSSTSNVPGSSFVMEAFTDTAAEQGQQLWEEDGTPILGYTPDGLFDVVHEAMGFQFIHNDRGVQVARVKELMTPGGIAIFEEKFVPGAGLSQAEWRQNEVVKDQFKLQYFTAQAIAEKQATILENTNEEATVGMNDLMVAPGDFEAVLATNFAYAAQFWDSGNFKGYVGSDSKEALDKFLGALVDTSTPFSTASTPRPLAVVETFNQSSLEEAYANSASLAGHNPTARYMIAHGQTQNGLQQRQEANTGSVGGEPGFALDVAAAAVAQGGQVPFQFELYPGVDLGTPVDPQVTGSWLEVDGEDRPTHNANGDLIAATEGALRNFWRWFGDSEMVDVDGRPVLFYHGTKADFTKSPRDQFVFSTRYTETFFFSIDTKTASSFAKDATKGLFAAYLRAEQVDKYDAEGRMWSEVLEPDDDEVYAAEHLWLDTQMDTFTPDGFVDQRDDGTWYAVLPGVSEEQEYEDEQEALDALEEAQDAQREQYRDDLGENPPAYYELAEMGYLSTEGRSTDDIAARSAGDYDAVLIDDVDEGSGATTVAIMLGDPLNIKAADNHGAFDPQDPRIFYQEDSEAAADPERAFRGENLSPTRATRHADGTVYADAAPWYPDRLIKVAEKIGAKEIIPVERDDPRLTQGVPLWHTAPPVNADGTISLQHWGADGVEVTDPTLWGKGGNLSRSERSSITSSLPRTYFGIASGQPGGYSVEFPWRTQYEARVPAEKLYDIRRDPDGLKRGDGVIPLENRVKAAGYVGYWVKDNYLGLVAVVFEPLAVRPGSAQTMFQDAVFFSALERTLENTATQKASAQQWEATLRKTPGIKAEELEWTGILDFLEMQEGAITRDQLLEVVRGAGLRVDEVLLGAIVKKGSFEAQVTAFEEQGLSAEDALEAAYQARKERAAQVTQFSSWTTDQNNDTYRELLITLPVGTGRNPNRAPSTHWDTDGVIAHARFMDKTDTDGKKVLFIEEVQSDWHQKGRDQGYAQAVDPSVTAKLREQVAADMAELKQVFSEVYNALPPNKQWLSVPPGDAVEMQFEIASDLNRAGAATEDKKRVARAQARLNLSIRELGAATRTSGNPNAPFRTGWPALVMKRMIRWAAEHGYERIAWTTGEQQAARYNLSQSVERLTVARDGEDYRVTLANFRAENALLEQGIGRRPDSIARSGIVMTEAQLKEAFGENIAQQIVGGATDLQGDDLRVGGEGMKAFYDRNLVNITNKLVKKYGAKVGPVRVVEETREWGSVEYLEQSVAHKEGLLAEIDANPDEFDLEGAAVVRKNLEIDRAKLEKAREGNPQPGFDITPELADAAMGGFPLFQRERAPRGQIAFGADITKTPSVITLLRGADLSTFVHELGHFFFEVTNDMASRPGAPAEVVADRDALLRYIGVESITDWENRTPEQRRDGHERIARSFEAYLFEGRAPSLELRGVFGKMRSFMLAVYRSIRRLDVELTDEVRGVFDRMLASEEAITEAQADAEMSPLFKDKPEGMTESDWEEYQALGQEATEEAAKQLERRSLRDMRYSGKAVAREIKRLQREVADQRAAMREEVEAEMAEKPVYRAITLFRTGMLDGEQYETDAKLNLEVVNEMLMLEGDPIPDALRGMTLTGGLHPQQAAELLGFTSGDHLLRDLLFASPFGEAVDAETDARMRERYGEVATPEDVEEAARAAVHNEVRGRHAATELAALQKAPGKKRVLANAARKLALDTVARLKIRQLLPAQYEAAERRAARAAQEAGTENLEEAVRQKRNQLLQFNLARATHEAREEVRAIRDYLSKFNNKNTRAAIDTAFLDQIDQLLESVDLRQVSNKGADRRKDLKAWVEKMQAEGFEPALDPDLMAELGRTPWRELTVEQLRGLRDGVKNIEHLGRLTKKLLTAKDKADLDMVAGEMGDAVRVNATRDVDQIVGAKTWWELVKGGTADFFMMHRKIANLAYIFDGNSYGGVFWERFIRPMNEAGDRENTMTRDANLRLAALFAPLMRQNTSKREYEPAIGKSISLEDRLMVALNMGNEANLQRLMSGDRWEMEQLQAIIAPLTAEHWDFVENVWREIDAWWPQIAAKELRVTGVMPEKVEPMPFQVNVGGALRYIPGGYFPIKYDADRSSRADADEGAEVLKQMTRGLYTNASTRRGHTKARVDEVNNRPLRKDFGVIFGHVTQVIHDLAWHEYLIDANRLLKHGAVDSAIRDHHGPETLRWMRKALEDIAVGDLGALSAFEKSVRHLRAGVSISAMGWSVWTSLLQPTGLSQSMARIGSKHVIRAIGALLGNPAKINQKVQWIYNVSPMMAARGETMQREIAEVRSHIGPKSPLRKAVDRVLPEGTASLVGDSFFVLITKAQLMADVPTWLAQYQKSVEEGVDPDTAVAIADQAVIDSQGGGTIKDLAAIQRGGELQKLFTNFYSYFSSTFNLMSDRTTQLRRVGQKDLPFYVVDMLLLTVFPATIGSLMYSLLRTEGDDDEDWLALLEEVAVDNLAYLMGLMVGVREIGGTLSGIAGYQGPAGTRFFAELGRLGKQASQGEADEAAIRAANSTAGILLHYPASQLDRTARGVVAVAKGEAGPQAVALGPPTGQ